MLPAIRQDEYLYEIPQFGVEKDDVDDFMGQLRAFHGEFSEYFCRQEPRDHFFNYMSGRFGDLKRKTAEPIAIRTSGRSPVRARQRNLSHAIWDEPGILRKYHETVRTEMGAPDGVLIFDESGFVKKGKNSAGVARQYCGTVGKVENCQVGVFAAYASRHGYALVNKRLFIPERWFGDDYDERRKKCEIPPDTVFKTKPELAAEMLREAYHRQRIPFRYITGDTVYGKSPVFVEAADSCAGVTYMPAVPPIPGYGSVSRL
ncbi:hypothetical protein DENIS_2923 [Desulfonema ishimotonii]|uniref:Transposase IS701-like DDE domain-containing protein n=1 Tax=Desulfonema ishimotonii TaxID=45657 RepID=A0A401FYB6_9BACT|nr:transposase [Desulfonema ishimotonii]GBC61961.1 hypothetical protein DENIS_2923 [Desulfonema ishimotonii]